MKPLPFGRPRWTEAQRSGLLNSDRWLSGLWKNTLDILEKFSLGAGRPAVFLFGKNHI